MNMLCKLCGIEFEIGRLQVHLKKIHKVDIETYYITYINSTADKLCSICGNPKKFSGFVHGYSKTCGNISCRAKYININYKENQKAGCRQRNEKWKNEIVDGKTTQQIII